VSNIVAVAAGEYDSLALTSNGTVVAWGANQSGESVVPPALSNVVAIAAGWSYSLALTLSNIIPPPVALTNPIWFSNSFNVSFRSQNGVSYILQCTGVLAPANWAIVQSASGTGGVLTLTDANATAAQRFYRVETQ
jgi:hypothetical protein